MIHKKHLLFYFALSFVLLVIMPIFQTKYLNLPIKLSHRPYDKLKHHTNKYISHIHKLHFAQNYALRPQDMFFGLQLKVQGFDYLLSIDTGSSDFVIKGKGTTGQPQQKYACDPCIKNRPKYNIGYLDGELQTFQKSLQIQLGKHKFNQSILIAYKTYNSNFDDDGGILGLSYPKLAKNPNPNFINTLINQKIIDVYAFGVNLNFKNKDNSLINFGKYDQSLFQGKLTLYDIQSSYEYMIGIKGISFGQGKDRSSLLQIDQALLDTGNTCISIPEIYVQQILDQFTKDADGQQTGNRCYFQVESNIQMFSLLLCRVSNFSKLPQLNIHVGNQVYPISKQFYLQQCSQRSSSDIKMYGDQAWYCQTYIESVKNFNQLILGDAFFTRFYTYFDLQIKKIGLAENKQNISMQEIKKDFVLKQSDWEVLYPQNNNQDSKWNNLQNNNGDQNNDNGNNEWSSQQNENSQEEQDNWFISFWKRLFGIH